MTPAACASRTEWRGSLLVLAAALLVVPLTVAQTRRTTAAPATAMRTEPAKVNCPQVLGPGVQSSRAFCDVATNRDPAEGVIIPLPPQTGAVTLTFDLHNRHTYSEEL